MGDARVYSNIVLVDTRDERDKFIEDANRLATDISGNQTFYTVKPLLNFWAAFTPSAEVQWLPSCQRVYRTNLNTITEFALRLYAKIRHLYVNVTSESIISSVRSFRARNFT